MAFKTEEQLAVFSQEYDGHVFRDKAGELDSCALVVQIAQLRGGNESQAVVEFAPYQKVPSDRKKQDARVGTIDKGLQPDPIVYAFIDANRFRRRLRLILGIATRRTL